MEGEEKKHSAKLGIRIGLVFLLAFCILIFVAYYVLSENFQSLLTDHTLKLLQGMVEQGVTTVEYELRVSKEEIAALASSFSAPTEEGQELTFPTSSSASDALRMVYVSEYGSIASDERIRDISNRRDITEAYEGKIGVYGPYFNEENEYVICYSAPVYQNDEILGILCIEKDGYYFCELIKNLCFGSTGESYIINAEGTDIAVSNLEHIEWVNEQYNARLLLKEQEDSTTRSVMEVEQKGIDGEAGVGTYYWDDGLCYLVYSPIPSVQWVLLTSLCQEELVSMTRSALYASILKEPILVFCIIVFFLLTGIIIFWIISSMKKDAEINERLKMAAHYDALTGLMNRNRYQSALHTLSSGKYHSLACIYIDANGLHEINNHLGHQAGDKMLKTVADVLLNVFLQDDIFRIGGDEFVVLCHNQDKQSIYQKAKLVRQDVKSHGYEVSIGVKWSDIQLDINTIVHMAEETMQQDKRKYYRENGKERQLRTLDQEMEQMALEKQDADTFLSVLAPEFKGVYFVDLNRDTIRHLYIPPYFEEMLKETQDIFSRALFLYAERLIAAKYYQQFIDFCDYGQIKKQLSRNAILELQYQKKDGIWLKLQILKFKAYTAQCQETLWIFSDID